MIGLEFRKVIGSLWVLFMACGLVVLQILVCLGTLLLPGENGYSPREVNLLYREMGEDQAEYIRRKAEELVAPQATAQLTQESLDALVKKLALYSDVGAEVEKIQSYPDYLQSIAAEAERMEGASLLFHPDSFSARSIQRIARQYAALSRLPERWAPSAGLLLLTDNRLADGCILLFVALVALQLTVRERVEGHHRLLYAISGGCRRSWLAKWAVLLALTLAATAAFYLPSGLMARWLAGWGDGSQPVQATVAYFQCPYSLTISQFLCLFFLAKIMGLWAVVTVLYAAVCRFSSLLSAIGGLGLVFGASGAVWLLVERSSWYGLLKECSLFALLDTRHYFSDALYTNCMEYPLSAGGVGIGAMLAAAAVCIPLSRAFWCRPTTTHSRPLFFPWPRRKSSRVYGLFWQEGRKLWIINRAGLVFGAMTVLLLATILLSPPFSQQQYYYQKYAAALRGELTAEKADFLQEEESRIANANQEIAALSRQVEAGELTPEAFSLLYEQFQVPYTQQLAFEQVQQQYSQLLVRQAAGEPVQFLDESGWQALSSDWGRGMDALQALWTAALLALCIFHFGAMEAETGVAMLLRTCPDGRRRVYAAKKHWVCILAVAAVSAGWGVKILRVSQVFPLEGLLCPGLSAGSITALEGAFAPLPVPVFALVQLVCLWAEAALLAQAMLYASWRAKNSLSALFFCVLIPAANFLFLSMAKIRPLLLGRQSMAAGLVVAVACLVAWLLSAAAGRKGKTG